MELAKVALSEIDPCHVDVVELGGNGSRCLLTDFSLGHLLGHEAVDVPVVVGKLPRILKVVEYILA